MGIQERTGKNETRDAEMHVCSRRSGEEVDESRLHPHEAEQNKAVLMTKCQLCDDGIESRLKQNRAMTENAKMKRREKCEKNSIGSDEGET